MRATVGAIESHLEEREGEHRGTSRFNVTPSSDLQALLSQLDQTLDDHALSADAMRWIADADRAPLLNAHDQLSTFLQRVTRGAAPGEVEDLMSLLAERNGGRSAAPGSGEVSEH